MRDATDKDGTMCPVKTVGNPGIIMSQTCEDCTIRPSGKFTVSGLSAIRLLSTSTPSIIKMDVAPVSAIARSREIVTAETTCFTGAGVAAQMCAWRRGNMVETLEADTVSSSEKSTSNGVGSEVNVVAETKCLHLYANNGNFAPHRQAIRLEGKIDLCIPLVHGSYPAAMNC